MIDAVDSFSEYVRTRIVAFNSARVVHGVIEASEWPPNKVDMEAFYCLLLGMRPLHRDAYTATAPAYMYLLQWVWLIAGQDILPGQEQANRGDRYRTHMTMCEELRQGLAPYFTERLKWSISSSGSLQSASLPIQGVLWWAPADFKHRIDNKSGLLYGFASVTANSFTNSVTS